MGEGWGAKGKDGGRRNPRIHITRFPKEPKRTPEAIW